MNPMKTLIPCLIVASLCGGARVAAQSSAYTNFVRQVQFPGGLEYDASVNPSGSDFSQLAINPGGARFELWTVHSTTLARYLISSSYVGTYIPVATVVIRSEDETAAIPRTRADRPFFVDVTVSGLLTGDGVPEPSKSVKFLRHVQSYGVNGTDVGIDRAQAILFSQSSITGNGTQNLEFLINSVPGADRAKVRGEERYTIFSLEDYQAPESQIASQYIQIWPVADGSITGISQGQFIRYQLPQVTLTANDLYPSSTTYAQVYKGEKRDNVTGRIIPGSAVVISDSVPKNKILVLDDYDEVFDEDGRWTMELLTVTPFGTDRLSYVTFDLDRTMKVNGTFVTIE
jgi:hypothetical protein